MKKIILVVLMGSAMGMMGGCDKAAETASKEAKQITGGPADGQTGDWYYTHPSEAKAEAHYCEKIYPELFSGAITITNAADKTSDSCKNVKLAVNLLIKQGKIQKFD